MEYDMEITNSNGDIFYSTIDAVMVDQANGWRDLTPELRHGLARRGLETLSQSLAIDYLSDAIVEGDCDTLRGTKGRTYASMVRRGLDLEIDDTWNRSGTAFELGFGGLKVTIELDPDSIETIEDLIQYGMAADSRTRSTLAGEHREYVSEFIRDYWRYVHWNEHGNGPALRECPNLAVQLVHDLTVEPDHAITQYLTGDGDTDLLARDWESNGLLIRRATIQHLFGVEPDWNLWE